MKKTQKRSLLKLLVAFIKLQLAGNILFWGTMAGSWLFDTLMNWPPVLNVGVAAIFAHALFFMVNKEWIYDSKENRRKTGQEIRRFILFMTMNYFLNLLLIEIWTLLGINQYFAQLINAFIFTIWNFLGLHFWVFETQKHHALTYHSVKKHRAKQAAKAKPRKRRR